MTHARIYQQGVKAFFNAKPLGRNPYDSAINSEAHEAWKDGWLDANHSRWRLYASLAAMRAYVSKDAISAIAVPRMEMPDASWRTILKGRPATPDATCGLRDGIPSHPDQTGALGA